jgi:hypothetical protein
MAASEGKTNPKQEADISAILLQSDQRSNTASSEEGRLAAGISTIGLQAWNLSGTQRKKLCNRITHYVLLRGFGPQRCNVFWSLVVKPTDIVQP